MSIPEGQAGVTLILDGELPALPGQFAMVWLPGIEERPFTLMDDDPASLTVADIGPFTHALCALQPGERLWLRGPFGRGFELRGERPLLLGGGSGAASLTLLAKAARRQGQKVRAALGARRGELLMLPWRFEGLGCRVILATDDGSRGYRGTVLAAVDELLQDGGADGIYACGPEPMLRAVVRRAAELDLPCQVSLERVMRCGLGVCGSCACGDRLVCSDGPVFAGAEALWMLHVNGDLTQRGAGG